MRLSAGVVVLFLALTSVWVGECGSNPPPPRRGEVRPNPIGGRRDREREGRGKRDSFVERPGVYEGLRRRGDDGDEDDSRGLERRKDMQAARGRRLVGERERTAPGSRNGPLSTYERRGSGKVPSRRNTGSSEEHQFCNDGEFEYEGEDLYSNDEVNDYSDEQEPWGRVGSSRMHGRGDDSLSRRRGKRLDHHPKRRGRLLSSSRHMRDSRSQQPSLYGSLLNDLSSTIWDRMAQVKEDTSGRVQEWKNLYKCKVSSQFERYMLQLTWPDDNAVAEPFIRDVVKHLEYDDGYYSVKDKRNPFRRTLRKIWSRMKERDYRSVLKATFILHHMCYDLSPRSARLLYDHFRHLRHEFDHKNEREHYFTRKRVLDLSSSGEAYESFVKAYYDFTVQRLRILGPLGGGKGSPLPLLGVMTDLGQEDDAPVITEKDAVATLMQIGKLIDAVSLCVVPKRLLRPLISSLMDFCAMDVSEMWKGYVDGVEIIAGKASFPAAWDRTGSGAASEESKASLLESAISSQDCLKDYLTKVHRLTSRKRNKRYGRMATSDVLPVSLDAQELESCVAALLRGERDDGMEEANVEELEEECSEKEEPKSNVQVQGLDAVDEEKPSTFEHVCPDGIADDQATPHVDKVEELHCNVITNEGQEEGGSCRVEHTDHELLASIGMHDYDQDGERLGKETDKSGDVLREDPECEDSMDP